MLDALNCESLTEFYPAVLSDYSVNPVPRVISGRRDDSSSQFHLEPAELGPADLQLKSMRLSNTLGDVKAEAKTASMPATSFVRPE